MCVIKFTLINSLWSLVQTASARGRPPCLTGHLWRTVAQLWLHKIHQLSKQTAGPPKTTAPAGACCFQIHTSAENVGWQLRAWWMLYSDSSDNIGSATVPTQTGWLIPNLPIAPGEPAIANTLAAFTVSRLSSWTRPLEGAWLLVCYVKVLRNVLIFWRSRKKVLPD